MKTELIFPTPVWKFDNVGADRQKILDFVDVVRKEDPDGRVASNDGGWQSWDFIEGVMDNNPLKEIKDMIMERAYAASDEWGFEHYTLKMVNLWVNVNNKGHFNHLHTHPGGILSGVYYVKLPSCCHGHLTFVRDFKDQQMKEFWGNNDNYNRWEHMNETEHDVFPEEDQLVIFPGWLPHAVGKSAGEGDRISISFNITAYSNFYHEMYPNR